MKDNSKLVAAILIALAAGAVIGFLSAPEKGKKMRKKIKKSLYRVGDTMKETAEAGMGRLDGIKDKVKEFI